MKANGWYWAAGITSGILLAGVVVALICALSANGRSTPELRKVEINNIPEVDSLARNLSRNVDSLYNVISNKEFIINNTVSIECISKQDTVMFILKK